MFKSFVDQKLSPSQRRKRNKYETEFTYKDLIERSIRRRKKTNASFTFIRDIKVTEAENQVEKAQEKMIHILPTIIDLNKPSLKMSPSYDSFTDGNLGFLNSNEITEERRMSIITKLNTVRNANQSSYDVLLLSKDLSENKKVNELDNIPSIYISNSKNFESKKTGNIAIPPECIQIARSSSISKIDIPKSDFKTRNVSFDNRNRSLNHFQNSIESYTTVDNTDTKEKSSIEKKAIKILDKGESFISNKGFDNCQNLTFEKRRASNLKERTVRNATFRNVSPVDENHEYSKDLMSLAKSTFITEKFGNFKNVISMVDNVQNLYEKYDKKVNFITSVIQDMGSAPPKLILPIMTWKREDLKSREKEANRIAKEYKFGGTDPSSNIK